MTHVPRVTVLVPARNEEEDIADCLRAVLAQDHPHDRMEIVVVDGGSTDRTSARASGVLTSGDIPWVIISNAAGTTPSNLNAGLRAATGELLCRVDARSIIPPHYVRTCAETLGSRAEVVVTGGAQVAVATSSSPWAVGTARALNNRYAMGGSRYRSGRPSGPSDTVYLGAFRTEELRAAGGWDERMHTNQDYELNRRMGSRGVVWFDDRIPVHYRPRRSIRLLWSQYRRFGNWKVRYWRLTADPPRPRQAVPIVVMTAGLPAVAVALVAGGPRCRVAVASGSLGALIAVDHFGGSDGEAVGVRARLCATGALVAVVSGWYAGIARGVLEASVGR